VASPSSNVTDEGASDSTVGFEALDEAGGEYRSKLNFSESKKPRIISFCWRGLAGRLKRTGKL
jgi:hypothetical protein